MKAHRSECCHRGRRENRPATGATFGVVLTVLTALMPKCPMCIAAWLGVVGLSGLATRFDPRAVWALGAMALAVLAAAIAYRLTRKGKDDEARDGNT